VSHLLQVDQPPIKGALLITPEFKVYTHRAARVRRSVDGQADSGGRNRSVQTLYVLARVQARAIQAALLQSARRAWGPPPSVVV
jgi:hypothetical protein